jgi:hypothetical protein
MNLRSGLFLVLMVLVQFQTAGQVTLSGFVKDRENGEVLIGAFAMDTVNSKVTTTNEYGYFSIQCRTKCTALKFSYIGYSTLTIIVKSNKDTALDILLTKNALLNEVIVNGGYNGLKSNLTGIETMSSKMVNSLPSIMGEPDIIKTLTFLPGVSFGNEAVSGYFVRGGSSDQNLILIDGVPIYNPYHLHGYFSVFNSDAINNATLYKGAVPANYGGRLSSVFDITMREGNSKKLSSKLTIGTITTKILIEGPIINEKTSFLITARRSMLDVFNPLISSNLAFFNGMSRVAKDIDLANYYFYDYNAKVNHKVNSKNRVFVCFYSSKDNYRNKNSEFALKNAIIWENTAASLRWNHIYSNSLFSNLTLYYSKYNYCSKDALVIQGSGTDLENSIEYTTGICDYSVKEDFNYNFNKHLLKFGFQYLNQTLAPAISTVNQLGSESGQNIDTTFNSLIYTHEAIMYFEDEFNLFDKVSMIAGAHLCGYFVDNRFYPSIQPRFSLYYLPFNNISIKGSYSRMVQPLHLLSNTWSGDPSDIWVPSTSQVKPENSNQFAAGITYNANSIYLTAEAFWKNMNNLIDYKEGASFFNSQSNWQDKIETGSGKAHGLELSLKKEKGKLTGLLSYAHSKSVRKFENINNGNQFPYIYDRAHSVSSALTYSINNKFSVGANWLFASGQPTTIAESYVINNLNLYREEYYKHFNSINGAKLPNYHRLDICMNYVRNYRLFNYQISTGIYNVYNRKNPYSIYDTGESLYINSLMGLVPYITLSIGFNTK